MKAYVTSHIQARGIQRVAAALAAHAPEWVEIVTDRTQADLVVHHVVGVDNFDVATIDRRVIDDLAAGRRYAVVQYCYLSAGNTALFESIWEDAALVWSYLQVQSLAPINFYRAPLGVDAAFAQPLPPHVRDVGVITTGYVAGPGAEAIEEVAIAAARANLAVIHVGPFPEGMTKLVPGRFGCVHNITDAQLARLYGRARFVSGLRHIEGFELPAAEGLCCGARPILFDREDMRAWYGGNGIYVPEHGRSELIEDLARVFANRPRPVTAQEQADARHRFDWAMIVGGFWQRVAQAVPDWAEQEQEVQ